MTSENTRRIVMVISGMILISSLTQIPFLITVETASAGSGWTQTTYDDFTAGTLEAVEVSPDGNVTLAMQTGYIEDDFLDDSRIGYRKHVTVDTAAGEVRLVKGINKTFGGADLDWGWWVQQTSDGGYALFAETVSYGAGNYDAWLIKTDPQGNEEWSRTFGGGQKDGARTGQQTSDNGFIIGGYADSYGFPGHDGWLIKTDVTGNELWNYTYGGPSTDAFYSTVQTSDDGFVSTGYETSFGGGGYDTWLVKTDSSGIMQWSKDYGGDGSEHGMSVKQSTDGGYIITGYTSSYGAGGTDLWLVKTDTSGNEQWNKTFGGTDDDWGGSVFHTSDGGYIVSGDTRSYGQGGYDVWLIKTDEFGYESWNVTYGGPLSDDTGYCIHQTSDGGYIVAVSSTSFISGTTDIWLVKTDSNGIEEWTRTFGGFDEDWGYCVDHTEDGGYAITGYTTSFGGAGLEVWLIKTDSLGYCDPEGELISTNLLSGDGALLIETFNCTASLPTDTIVQVQFSQDNSTWYDSGGAMGGWNFLMDGFNFIELSFLGWNGSEFYYRMKFSSTADGIPVLMNVNVSYTRYSSPGTLTSQSFDCTNENMYWKTLGWISTEPPGTEIKFQLRAADLQANLSTTNFTGPGGSTSTYYVSSPADIWSGLDCNQWVQFKVFLMGTGESTPTLQEVTIEYDLVPDAVTNLTIDIWGANLLLSWAPPQNNPNPVDHYLIYRSTTWDGFDFATPWVNTSLDSDNGIMPLRTSWNDTGALLDEGNNYFYIVRVVDIEGWNDTNTNIVGKYVIQLKSGWNMISLPLSQRNTSISTVLQTIDGEYNVIWIYDAEYDNWRSSSTDLSDIDRTMGLWIHMKNSCNLSVIGAVPESTDILLYEGWNLVGYPSLAARNINDALDGIAWQAVQHWNASDSTDPWKHNSTKKPDLLNDLESMQCGHGYWIHVAINDTWTRTRYIEDREAVKWTVKGFERREIDGYDSESGIEQSLTIENDDCDRSDAIPEEPVYKTEPTWMNFPSILLILLIVLIIIEIKPNKKMNRPNK